MNPTAAPSPADPAPAEPTPAELAPAELAALLGAVRADAGRLCDALGDLTDRQAREASALPGWSRAHVITHVARSADAYRHLLALARTGTAPGPRPDRGAPDRALRAGAERDAAELVADLRRSLDGLSDEAATVPAERWTAPVRALAGWWHPAWFTLHRARRELQTHHVDLALGRTTADWPTDYVAWALDTTVATLAARDFPVARLEATDLGRSWTPAATGATVSAPGHVLLAWLAGRGPAPDSHAGRTLPTPPVWPLPPVPGWG
ncbi:maleylpyruvate isomerase family mycothiol-dependent enzyme [Kitasatospora sp. NPDC059577]|uniref:maleylpyruvate isomerase family mycothiol-dependent enzyme n=1 Tax=Kitasatospora sp. NPDC059577 TaxID=3346873 RepID=UPI0036AADA8C